MFSAVSFLHTVHIVALYSIPVTNHRERFFLTWFQGNNLKNGLAEDEMAWDSTHNQHSVFRAII